MGIDIQQYRASIGSFFPTGNFIYNYSRKNLSKLTNLESTKMNYFRISILAALFLFISSIYCQNIYQSGRSSTSQDCSSTLTTASGSEIICGSDVFSLNFFTMITNFMSRYVNGNRSSKGIKIGHWNKGNSYLINKMHDIKTIIWQHHTHILGVSEASLNAGHDQSLASIPDFNLHLWPTINNPSLGSSRIVVYTHKDIVAKIRPDLMCDTYSSIWLEVGLPHHKRFLVNQSYREWQQKGNKTSITIPEQLSRWLVFLD